MLKYFIIFILIVLSLTGCKNNQSSNVYFDYQGYGDTTLALLYGKVIDFQNKPIRGTKIKFLNSNYETISDSLGYFEIYSSNAEYDVSFFKEGFQTILLKGYFSQSDQIARIEIKLSSFKTDTLTIIGAVN